jgi:hypothetical protein
MQSVLVTPEVLTKEAALSEKISRLQSRIFGFPLSRFSVESVKKVLVPYRCFVFDFEPVSGISRIGIGASRKGSVGVVFDLNELHAFECDPSVAGELRLEKREDAGGAQMLAPNCSGKEAEEHVRLYVQNKILRRVYGRAGSLTPVRDVDFRRPAWQLEIRYKGRGGTHIRYAYSDAYGTRNEHILGLKLRLS